MSKLAALAAARKKREAEKRGNQNGGDNDATADAGGESAASKATDDQRSKSISLLDRLATNGKPSTSGATQARVPKFPLRKDGRDRDRERERGVVERKGREIAQSPTKQAPQEPVPAVTETSVEAAGPNEEEDRISSPLEDLRAEPSTFAAIILGETTSSDSPVSKQNAPVHNFFDFVVQDVTEVFNFAEPSPDDVVLNAQNTAKSESILPSWFFLCQSVYRPDFYPDNKSKRTTAQQSASKSQGDLADNVKQLSVQEKVKSKNLNVLEEHRKATRKKAANFVVIGEWLLLLSLYFGLLTCVSCIVGHVDAGKSTLMGRLLFDLKAVDQRTLEKYRREADKIGKGSFALAWVLDQGSEERARGVTIDIATNKFETETTSFTVLDAPGHRDFVPNMIAGASQADFAVLVVDSSTGNFESGLKGQTKEHALLVRSMGVQKIVVAVNKMDAVNWSKDRFDEIEQQVSSFLTTAGFQARNISSVPCSGLSGDNVARKSEAKSSAWYTGNTLVEELETSEPYSYALDKPLRMTISDIFRGGVQHPLSISGRLDAGSLQIGDQVVTMPSRETATIKGVEVDQEPSDWAVAGQNVVLHLTDIDPVHLKTGDLICSPTSPVQNITSFTAKVLAFDHVTPMHIDVHRGTLYVPGRITKLVATLDKASGAAMKKKPKIVAPGTVARVVVEMERAIPLEAPARVVFRASGETVAAGLLE